MFFYFEPIFIEKFLWESDFSNFGHMTIFAKPKFFFWPAFWKKTFLIFFFFFFFFANLLLCPFRTKIHTEKYLKMVVS